MRRVLILLLAAATVGSATGNLAAKEAAQPALAKVTQGQLRAIGPEGKPLGNCPLKHTDVRASIAGFIARVTVTQEFVNPFKDKIEAVYVFPLGADAAVDDMTMQIGERIIRGLIKPREEARQIYEQAKAKGHVASLLDQERPNIFTQSVANIEPGKKILITISYSETLKYEDGKFSFVFPMVVGPRYIPGAPSGQSGTGWAPDTTEVPDASKITPPVTPEGTRAGHDISVFVLIDAGMKLRSLDSRQHKVLTRWLDEQHTRAKVELAKEVVIPNKDFVLEYSTASERIEDAVLTHTDARGGFITLILQPPKKVPPKLIRGRELVFVIDSSGSMSGFPIETAKKCMARCIKNLRPSDTLNLITFAGHTSMLWQGPRPNTKANREKALDFLSTLRGAGGTEMMKAIRACLEGPRDPQRVRIVCFMTDGYVGNDMAIVDAVRKNVDTARVFSFGIGRSVNRYLLDNMARAGRGEVEYVLDDKLADAAADRFYDRISAPVLTDIRIDWGDLAAAVEADEAYPTHIMDLFSVKPVVVKGRYRPGEADAVGFITIGGNTGEGTFSRRVKVTLPAARAENEVLAPLWARAKVAELMDKDLAAVQAGKPDPAIKETIVGLGMKYRLLTQFTSFVAVEEKTVTVGGQPRTVAVPVEMPEGVSYEGVFGEQGRLVAGVGGGGAPAGARARGRFLAAGSARQTSAAPTMSLMKSRNEVRSLEFFQAGQAAKTGLARIKADEKLSEADKRVKVGELKLAEALQGLEKKLDEKGNYASGKVVVKGGKIEVAVYLYELDEKALAELKKLGFVKLLEAKAVKMVVGTVEVKKLADLAWLDAVRRIDLPSFVK